MQRNNLGQKHIENISIYSFHEVISPAARIPLTTEEAQLSLPRPVAAAVVRDLLDRLSGNFHNRDMKH